MSYKKLELGSNVESKLINYNFLGYSTTILILGVISFFIFRIWFVLAFARDAFIQASIYDIWSVFLMSLRFDLKVSSVFILVFLLFYGVFYLSNITLNFIKDKRFKNKINILLLLSKRSLPGKYFLYTFFLLFAIVDLSSIAQIQFYSFVFAPFNVTLFGLFDDDTYSILVSIWNDYPVIILTLIFVAILFIQYKVALWLTVFFSKKIRNVSLTKKVILNIFNVIIVFLFARGSLGTYPLSIQNASVVASPVMNHATINSLTSLNAAFVERREMQDLSFRPESVKQMISSFGFNSLQEIADIFGVNEQVTDDLNGLHKVSEAKVPYYEGKISEERPPHVILPFMESWGRYFYNFHDSETNNLYGALDKYIQNDKSNEIFFKNFFGLRVFTFPVLEYVLFNSPIAPVSINVINMENNAFDTSALKPFKEQGYRTIFVHASSSYWRSLDQILPDQYFDEIYDLNDIIAKYPQAPRNRSWVATEDEYMFRFAYDLLEQADKQGDKVMMVLLSISHHTPNKKPIGYEPFPIDFEKVRDVAFYDEEQSIDILTTYQYSSHQLGLFVDNIKNSSFADKTIIAAVADHNLRAFFNYRQPEENRHISEVMNFFYIPEDYMLEGYSPDPDIFVEHKDIFPSLYHLVLPEGTTYLNFGNNLFAPIEPVKAYAQGLDNIYSEYGATEASFYTPRGRSVPYYFEWSDDKQEMYLVNEPAQGILLEQYNYQRALHALRTAFIRQEIQRIIESNKN